jgi:hypothetical protein
VHECICVFLTGSSLSLAPHTPIASSKRLKVQTTKCNTPFLSVSMTITPNTFISVNSKSTGSPKSAVFFRNVSVFFPLSHESARLTLLSLSTATIILVMTVNSHERTVPPEEITVSLNQRLLPRICSLLD